MSSRSSPNHPDLQDEVARFGVPYHHIPVTKDSKSEAEQAQIELLGRRGRTGMMARYMQVLSDDFLKRIGYPVINIHHSFLPAFAGAGPYRRAFDRGVKLIGATPITPPRTREGPIIEQDVIRVPTATMPTHSSASALMSNGWCSPARSSGISPTGCCCRAAAGIE